MAFTPSFSRIRPRNPVAWIHFLGIVGVAALIALGAVSSTHIAPSGRLPLYFAAWLLLWSACIVVGTWLSTDPKDAPLLSGTLRVVLLWAVIFRVIAFLLPPVMEDDYFRYLWDGRQMVQTGNPYAFPPSHSFEDPKLGPVFEPILERVNYPHVPTIYAPVLQYAFGIAYLISPGSLWPWKLILLLADLVVAGILWRKQKYQALAWYSWCPLVLQESGMTAHPDLLGAAFLAIAYFSRSRNGGIWTGIGLGLAAATKITGLIFVPFLLPDPRYWRGWVAFVMTFALVYAPFWMQGSAADWAGLTQFAKEWEFNSAGFAVLNGILGSTAGRFESLSLTLCGLAFLAWIQRDSSEPRLDVVCGWFFLWSAVIQPWYLLWALPWVFLRPTYTGFATLIAVSLSYIIPLHSGQTGADLYLHPPWVRPLEFGSILVALLFDIRSRRKQIF